MKRLLLLLFLVLCLAPVSAESEHPQPTMAEVKALLEQGAILVDVRTPEEFDGGHLEGALNIPYESILQLPKDRDVQADTPVVLYCQTGRRAGIAEDALKDAGYNNVHNAGRYDQLKAEIKK